MNLQEWHHPPTEFSLAPFWFWNDRLEETELARQMDEFQQHGVDAFVIHPRVGLPRDMGWMSDKLLAKIRFAIEEATRRKMWIILYDEGMYPSGSSSGQVVAENPAYQCRGLVRINLDTVQPNSIEQGIKIDDTGIPILSRYQSLVATVDNYAIIQRPVQAVIRGLHFINEDSPEPPEDEPLAIDLLNSEAVACFIRLVYQRYYDEFGDYFGNTIQAIFTDEPMLLGRLQETGIVAGTIDSLAGVNEFLGYDFTPHLPLLWDEEAPQSIRDDYERALEHRLERTYYQQLYKWCDEHNIDLTGHPAEPDATRHLRYFHIPGQDIVWRQIEADKASALEGRQSTQAKAASSMMSHGQRRRNANEFCGAYGHDLTFEEMRWLANWLLIRGCNLLIPHAFYYSVRGSRYHERPPDVGLHSQWWDNRFTEFALGSRRLAWLNTDSQHICHVAILGEHHHLAWRAAKDCFQHQIDFNYLDTDDLHLANRYKALVVDSELSIDLSQIDTPIFYWNADTQQCIASLRRHIPHSPFSDCNAQGLRIRQLEKSGYHWFIVFNEENTAIKIELNMPDTEVLNPYIDTQSPFTGTLALKGHEICVLVQQGTSLE